MHPLSWRFLFPQSSLPLHYDSPYHTITKLLSEWSSRQRSWNGKGQIRWMILWGLPPRNRRTDSGWAVFWDAIHQLYWVLLCITTISLHASVSTPGKYWGEQNRLPLYPNSMRLNVGSHPENHINTYVTEAWGYWQPFVASTRSRFNTHDWNICAGWLFP